MTDVELEFLKAPFPYFGGKRTVAADIWAALGDVDHYIEPFCGSAAVLLARPHWETGKTETINDFDSHIANLWRALKYKPDEVAEWCDWPVNHDDLRARKIVLNRDEPSMHQKLAANDMYCDHKMAGYYIWAACCWIGSGLTRPGQIPHLGTKGKGVHAAGKRPHLGTKGNGVHAAGQIPHLADKGNGIHAVSLASEPQGEFGQPFNTNIYRWFRTLQERLRYVRVVVGDWKQVCGGDWQDNNWPTVGMFFDPPYSHDIGRDNSIYGCEDADAARACAAWSIERGKRDNYRIVIAGYADEHPSLIDAGWRMKQWKAQGGYANLGKGKSNGKVNRHREALFFSPHCVGAAENLTLIDCTEAQK